MRYTTVIKDSMSTYCMMKQQIMLNFMTSIKHKYITNESSQYRYATDAKRFWICVQIYMYLSYTMHTIDSLILYCTTHIQSKSQQLSPLQLVACNNNNDTHIHFHTNYITVNDYYDTNYTCIAWLHYSFTSQSTHIAQFRYILIT